MGSAHDGQHRLPDRSATDTIALIAHHRPLHEILDTVCRSVEAFGPDVRCAVIVRGDPADLTIFGARTAVPAEIERIVRAEFARLDEAGDEEPMVVRIPDPEQANTRRFWFLVLNGLGARPIGALCVANDWTDHDEPAADAFRQAAYLAQIAVEQGSAASHFAGTIAAEREHIVNQLHDDPIQAITVLSLMLQRLGREVPDESRPLVAEARAKADTAIDRMRRMLFELHPAVLEEEGLAVATEVYLEEAVEPSGIGWTVEDRLVLHPDGATATLAFRLVHEALANVATHSGASTVSVVFSTEDNGLSITITDDGRGFDVGAIAPYRPGHLGIANVRHLARRAAGRFDVHSEPGHGCTVDIWIPISTSTRPPAAHQGA